MDTRQLAAFCAVVERRSFSQAAERLGVTQPAVSLQVRALEKRLGTQLLDRSGRRVEPTEAGWRLYRGAQRMLALEDQLLADVAASGEGELAGDLVLGASTGPAAVVVPVVLGEFQRLNPGVRVFLTVSDTHSVVERVAARELELGIVGASRRHRGVRFEPFFSDEVILVCPPGHRFAGRTVTLDELREEPLILMQEGAGVRQIVEDALRRQGVKLRDLDVRLELGLQESVRRAVEEGYGVTFISRTAVESELASRPARGGARRGARGDARDLARVRDRPCAHARRGGVRRLRARPARGLRLTKPATGGRCAHGSRVRGDPRGDLPLRDHADGRLRQEPDRRLHVEQRGRRGGGQGREGAEGLDRGREGGLQRVRRTASRCCEYLYALGWIGGTKNRTQCGLTLLGEDAAKEQAASRDAREHRSSSRS